MAVSPASTRVAVRRGLPSQTCRAQAWDLAAPPRPVCLPYPVKGK